MSFSSDFLFYIHGLLSENLEILFVTYSSESSLWPWCFFDNSCTGSHGFLFLELMSKSVREIFMRESSYCFQRIFLISHRNSACPSVCLSHGWISQKWCKLESPNLHCWLPGRL